MNITELTRMDVEQILAGNTQAAVTRSFPLYPLDSPEMPQPGPDFLKHASDLCGGDATEMAWRLPWLYLRAIYEPGTFSMPVAVKGTRKTLSVIPGHLWGSPVYGPQTPEEDPANPRPRVMLVGKVPMREDLQERRNMTGQSGQYLWDTLHDCGVPEDDLSRWYVCNVVRWFDPVLLKGALPAAWIRDTLPLLHQELRLLKPDFILCLGAEAVKVLCGPKESLSSMAGRQVELRIPIHEQGEEPNYHVAQVMAAYQPSYVLQLTERQPQFRGAVQAFANEVRGTTVAPLVNDITLHYIRKERELREIVDAILRKPGIKPISVDAEWQGQKTPQDPGAFLRTIQFSPDGHYAGVVVLRGRQGETVFAPGIEAAVTQLKRLCIRPDVQVIGHYFAADIPWLEHEGIPMQAQYDVPGDFDAFNGGNYGGGFDTALGYHAYNETDDFELKQLAVRHCGAQRWDIEVERYKDEYCRVHKIAKSDLEGYGEFPDEVLLPYGGYDAIYQWRLRDKLVRSGGFLDRDRFGLNSWRPFHNAMKAYPALVEMHKEGIYVDPAQIDTLTDVFQIAGDALLENLRRDINWPKFNPRSSYDCIEFLFGDAYAKRRDKQTGARVPNRPRDAITLNLMPIKSTGKKPTPWERVVEKGEQELNDPCTDKETCGILAMQNPLAGRLRDMRLTDHVLKSVFCRPEITVVDGKQIRTYDGGIASAIAADGHVHSTFYPTVETGRLSSSRPPLQNLSGRREADYQRILGDLYREPIRSLITADPRLPEPHVLVEADFSGAELLLLAIMSRDKTMIDHCLRNILPEDDPNYYDIHSSVCVSAFRLNCPPTKDGLKSLGKKHLRVAAKATIFTRNYGGTAETIARRIQEEGTMVTVAEVDQMLAAIDAMYPESKQFQLECGERATTPGWLASCYGRYRRTYPTDIPGVLGNIKRELANFGMQAGVADAMNDGLYYLRTHPRRKELGYLIVLQLHDAVMLSVPTRSLDAVYDEIMPECLTERVSFRSCTLDGTPYDDSPVYHFGAERKVCLRWGIPLSWDDCDRLKIDHRYGSKPETV